MPAITSICFSKGLKKTIVVLVLSLGTVLARAQIGPEPQPLYGKIIVLDPGHAVRNEGGAVINPGSRARRGVYERDVVLSVAEKVAGLLETQGARVYLTRTPDNPWRYNPRRMGDNRARAIFANVMRANAYVRIHCDWNRSRSFKGFTTFYYRWGSRDLAKGLRQEMVKNLPDHHDNGMHRRSFVSITARMPAVLLEIGTLSYKPEAKVMGTEAFQDKVAQAVAKGILDYFQKA